MNMSSKAVSPNQRALRLVGTKALYLMRKNKTRLVAARSGGIRSVIAGILAAAAKVPLNQEPTSNAGAQ